MSPENWQTAFVCRKARDSIAAYGRRSDPEINGMTLEAITDLAPLKCLCIAWNVGDNGERCREMV